VCLSGIVIVIWGCLSGVLSIILFELKISLGWVYLAMGNFIGSSVCPIAFAITWRKCSAVAAVSGALGGVFLCCLCCVCALFAIHLSYCKQWMHPCIFIVL
jgi:hypothetical protein